MGNLIDIQISAKALREEKTHLSLQIAKSKATLEKVESQIRTLKKQGIQESDKRLATLLQQKETLFSTKNRLSDELKKNSESLLGLSDKIKREYDPEKDIEQLDDSYPILLFPLRLETRFKKTGNQDQLWVRVYPDDCNIVKKEPILSEDELADVKVFWAEMAKAGKIESEERGAWSVLANSHGSNRASWIIEQYKPVNAYAAKTDASIKVLVLFDENDNPKDLKQEAVTYWKEVWQAQGDESKIETAKSNFQDLLPLDEYNYFISLSAYNILDVLPKEFDADKILISKINLPNPNSLVATQSSWNEAPQAIALPDKFVAITYSDGTKNTHVFENSVKNNLPVGVDPSLAENGIKKDNTGIHLNDELKWMVDFEEAVIAGMGTKINLSSADAITGFDQLFVFGLRASADSTTSVTELETLISAHKNSSQGFAFLKQGTPTNNTEHDGAGYSWSEDADESFDRLFKGTENFAVSDEALNQSDAQRFADSLNLNPDIFQGFPNANGKDQLESIAMNTALFPATMGYFMEEMMDPLFSDSDTEATRKLFANSISGRGPLPAFKIGRQPYGILPITRFSTLQFSKEKFFESKLIGLLKKIDETWDATVSQVNHVGKDGDSHQILLDVLGLHPNSIEFHQRYSQSIDQLHSQLKISTTNPIFSRTINSTIVARGQQILRDLGLDPETKLPILEKFFLSRPNKLSGPLVDDVPESETKPIRGYTGDNKNYIEWLQLTDGNKIRLQNFDGNPVPNALLYLLLRHSILLSQATAGTNLLLNEKLIESKKVFHDKPFLYIQQNDSGKSKFEHLYQPNERITNNNSTTLIEHIYNQEILNTKVETKVLNEVLEALKVLEKTPTARLERLLIEHLDCCSYRIDSWKTGLTYHQIKQQQQRRENQEKQKGIHLGAYGWLLDLRPKVGSLQEKSLTPQEAEFFAPNGEKIFADSTNLGYIHAPSIDQAATAAILRNAYDSNKDVGEQNPFAINLTSERVRIANDFLEGIRNGQPLSALLGYQFERGLHDRYQSSNIEADKFIYPLRMAFPLVTNQLKSAQTTDADVQEANETNNVTDTSIEAIEARNVVDGLKLIQFVQNSSTKTYPFGKSELVAATANERDAITAEVNRLIDINDAIVDLLMAEQVYQTVKGNFERSAAVANAYSNGSYPPEMEVVNTPRSGLNLNHKVAIHFDAKASALESPNSVDEITPKARSEASVNKWLSDLLPAPENVSVKIKVDDPDGTEKFLFVSQQDLGLQSIDLLFSAALDNEQAMTELDDRIVNYLLYDYVDSVGNPLNQFAKIAVLYTKEIDPNDKSKVSFLELGATLQSLRKILVNRPHVNYSSLQLPTENVNTNDIVYEVADYKNRIDRLKSELQTKYSELTAFIDAVVSIQSLLNKHTEKLVAENIPESVIEILNQYLNDQLKNYLLDQTATVKAGIISGYQSLLESNSIDNPLKATLLSDFETHLNNYATDLNELPNLIKNTCRHFMAIALFDNTLTGTGFIHQSVGGIFKQVVDNVNIIIARWNVKRTEYNVIMTEYVSAATDEEKFQILQKAERKVSSQSTPFPTDIDIYKTAVEQKNTTFNAVLADMTNIATASHSDVLAFLTAANAVLAKIADHDIVSYDTVNHRNDSYEQLKTLIQLKEDIYSANLNLATFIDNKLKGYDAVIVDFDGLNSDDERIELLTDAAKQVLKEDILLLPHLKLSPEYGSVVQLAYNQEAAIQQFSKTNEDRLFPVEDWLIGAARVRENLWHFENTLSLVNGYNPESTIELNPLQFPIRENARWLAMKFVDATENVDEYIKSLEGDTLLYTAHFAENFDPSKPVCGIVIDEWTEVVPLKNETTGIVFQYDQPNSEPPQSMLLVTPSQINGKWEWDDVIGAMEETLSMAKKRAVEPSMIDRTKFGQFLPTTLMAVSTHWITVAMNLSLNNIPISKAQ